MTPAKNQKNPSRQTQKTPIKSTACVPFLTPLTTLNKIPALNMKFLQLHLLQQYAHVNIKPVEIATLNHLLTQLTARAK